MKIFNFYDTFIWTYFGRSLTMNAITKSLAPCSEKEADDGFEFSNDKKCEGDCAESIAETQHCTKDIETKVFQHNTAGGLFSSLEDALNKNPDNPDADLYSILDSLENFRNQDGTFHLRVCYPELSVNGSSCNEWIQSSNPVTETEITGFQAISLVFTKNGANKSWEGLGLDRSNHTLIADSPKMVRKWGGAIGAKEWSSEGAGVIPGPKDHQPVTKVVLTALTKETHGKIYSCLSVLVDIE